jgi:hypothetical protein
MRVETARGADSLLTATKERSAARSTVEDGKTTRPAGFKTDVEGT